MTIALKEANARASCHFHKPPPISLPAPGWVIKPEWLSSSRQKHKEEKGDRASIRSGRSWGSRNQPRPFQCISVMLPLFTLSMWASRKGYWGLC